MSGATLFSTFDLTAGYHQVPVKDEDIPKTAFVTRYGQFEYLTMPMGLTNSGGTFQRLMEIVLQGLQWHTCLIYLDDVIVFSTDFDQHMERVETVLQRIKEAGLKLKPDKCHMLQEEVHFLGHVVSKDGVRPNPDNISKILQMPVPKNVTQTRQILGMGNYYRRFVKGYADMVRPMVDLTRKTKVFKWTPEAQKAFDALKSALTGPEVMGYPRDSGTFYLDTDASDIGIGAVLSQIQDGRERVIAYGSRTQDKAEKISV